MLSIQLIICKLIQSILKKIGRGSSLPGQIALKMNPKFLGKFHYPEKVVAVTGSSGKGSVTGMISAIALENHMIVAHNDKGSNLDAGIASLLIEHSDLKGNIKADIIVAEVDERYTKYVFPYLKPTHVVITNITRDQPPRQGHFDLVFHEIEKAITSDMHLILNADDPMLQKFVMKKKNPVTYYSIEKNKFSYTKSKFENLNFIYCPKCHTKLEYQYYNFEEIGDYHCPNCSFKRPNATNVCTKIDYKNQKILLNDNEIHLPSTMLYNIYNTLAAYTITKEIGINEHIIVAAINNLNSNGKNMNIYKIEQRNMIILNNKNENSSTFNQSLLFIDREKSLKTIVIGWKEISRRYEFNDISWLYDIDFEILTKHNIDKVVCIGLNEFDIATRMNYAGIDSSKIVPFDTLEKATTYIKKKTKGDIYAILNFDYVEPFHELMTRGEK